MIEEWRSVTSWPGYEVSNHGRVRRGNHVKTPFLDRKGYLKVKLWKHSKSRNFLVHRIVAEQFIGQIPIGHVCRHLNGEKSDNRAENLAYGTPSQNEADKRAHGTAGVGERHPAAKLTSAEVIEIRARFSASCRSSGSSALAKQYGVSQSLISAIVNRRVWKHIA